MADPVKYTPSYSFSGWQTANPGKPLPAQQVDNELAGISQSVNQVVDAVKDVRRSDGKLKNGTVTLDSLADEVKVPWTGGAIAAWAPVVPYTAGIAAQTAAPATVVIYSGETYVAAVAHTTTSVFDPAKWSKIAAKGVSGTGAGDMLAANNLSDVASAAQALSNLGAAAKTYVDTTFYAKTAFKYVGTGGAPVLFGSGGELSPTQVVIDNVGSQQRVDFNYGGVLKWLLVRNPDATFGLWNPTTGYTFQVDPNTNRMLFGAVPLIVGGLDLAYCDNDGKLHGYDGSKLTNLPLAILQSLMETYTASTSLTAAIPADDTKPQISEGTQILSLTITPKRSTSKIRWRFQCSGAVGGSGRGIAAAFLNGAADAIRVASSYNTNTGSFCLTMTGDFSPNSVAAQTITVRAGPAPASQFIINTVYVGNTFGGAMGATLEAEEIAA